MRFQISFTSIMLVSLLLPSSIVQADKKVPTTQKKAQPAKKGPAGFSGLITAVKKSPGCLGVGLARTTTGKNLIFAWFKDKKAALAWYHSDFHQKMIGNFSIKDSGRKPLADVPDDAGPIMAIASITFAKKPMLKGIKLPISQIAIELYTPLKGGLSAGGTFAPASLKKTK